MSAQCPLKQRLPVVLAQYEDRCGQSGLTLIYSLCNSKLKSLTRCQHFQTFSETIDYCTSGLSILINMGVKILVGSRFVQLIHQVRGSGVFHSSDIGAHHFLLKFCLWNNFQNERLVQLMGWKFDHRKWNLNADIYKRLTSLVIN